MMSNTVTRTGVLVSSLCAVLLPMTSSAFGADTLKAFPNAQLERSEQETRQNHPVIINRMKKVNGVVTSDDASWLEGALFRKLYQLPQGQTSEAGYDFFVEQFRALGTKELFSCSSFSCGESNYWANDIFNIALLYGQNRQQHYYIGEKRGTYYSVYSVRRGNGRIYTLVDIFRGQNDDRSEDISLEQLTRRGYYDLYISGPLADSHVLKRLEELLKQNRDINLLLQVQGVLPGNLADFDRQRETMQSQGQQILQTLVNEGIESNRLRVQTAASVSAIAELPADTLWLRVFLIN